MGQIKYNHIPSNLIRWVNENYFAESNIKEIHFYDNDREDYRELANEIRRTQDGRRYAWLTQRRELENYIPPKIIEGYFNIDLSQYYDEWEREDIPQLLCGKVMQDIKDYREREKIIKQILNGKLSKKITAESLKDISAFEQFETFFKKVRAVVDGTYVEKG